MWELAHGAVISATCVGALVLPRVSRVTCTSLRGHLSGTTASTELCPSGLEPKAVPQGQSVEVYSVHSVGNQPGPLCISCSLFTVAPLHLHCPLGHFHCVCVWLLGCVWVSVLGAGVWVRVARSPHIPCASHSHQWQ